MPVPGEPLDEPREPGGVEGHERRAPSAARPLGEAEHEVVGHQRPARLDLEVVELAPRLAADHAGRPRSRRWPPARRARPCARARRWSPPSSRGPPRRRRPAPTAPASSRPCRMARDGSSGVERTLWIFTPSGRKTTEIGEGATRVDPDPRRRRRGGRCAHTPLPNGRTRTPSRSSASRMRRTSCSAPGVSPCVQIVPTGRGMTAPSIALHHALARHAPDAIDDGGRVVDHRARLAPRHQRSVRLVGAVGEGLGHHAQPLPLARAQQLRVGQPEEDERVVHGGHGPGDRVGQRVILRRHVVERAVRLHVLQPHALGGGEARERPDLVGDRVLELVRRDGHLAAAEAHQVGQPRVRADGHAVRLREPHGLAHHARVAGVEAARDVGRRDRRHDLGVAADGVGAERLPHVAVEVDVHGSTVSLRPGPEAGDRLSLRPPPPSSRPRASWAGAAASRSGSRRPRTPSPDGRPCTRSGPDSPGSPRPR